jgi:protein O-mannosyl-transferase
MQQGLHAETEAPRERGLFFCTLRQPWLWLTLALIGSAPLIAALPGPLLLDDWGNLETLLGVAGSFGSVVDAMFNNASGLLLRPISNLSFVANLLATGPEPLPLKLTNLAFHVIAAGVAFAFTQRILALLQPDIPAHHATAIALLAAVIWAVHPLQVSTVMYVVQRMAILSALFSMLAVGAALRPLLMRDLSRRDTAISIALFGLFTLLALLSKENGALTPLLLGSVLVAIPALHSARFDRNAVRTGWAMVALPVIAGCVVVAIKWESLVGGFDGRPFSMAERLLSQPTILLGYLSSIVWPDPDRMGLFLDDIQAARLDDVVAWLAAATLVGVTAGLVAFRKRWPVAAFAALWFLGCHAMESTFLPLELAFEHRNYLALLGPAILLATLLFSLSSRLATQSGRRAAFTGSAIAVVACLMLITHERASRWSSLESFSMHEVRNRPLSLRAQNLAAIIDRRQGNVPSAVARMAAMKSLYPDSFFAHAMDMDFACDDSSHPTDWDGIHRTAVAGRGSSEVLGYFSHIVVRISLGECVGIDRPEMHARLQTLIDDALTHRATYAAQYFLVLRASLAESTHEEARAFMHEALALDQQSADLWQRLASMELAANNPTDALAALDALDALLPSYSPARHRLQRTREAALQMRSDARPEPGVQR